MKYLPLRSKLLSVSLYNTRSSKIGNAPSDLKLNITLTSQKYPIYTKYLPLMSKVLSVSLYDRWLQRYHTFYNSPLTTMLNIKKEQQNLPKIQNLKLHNSLYKFGRPFLGVCMNFWEQTCCALSDKMSFELFIPYSPL